MQTAQLSDAARFLATLTPRKVGNWARLAASYQRAMRSGQPTLWGMPAALSVEPTTACNLRCPQCISGLRAFTRPTGFLDVGMYQSLIEELHPWLCSLLFYFQGEPYLHPRFFELVRLAADRRIYTATSTNAHYLSDEQCRQTIESGLHRLVVSLDGLTPETYRTYRVGGQLERVVEGIRRLADWKKQLRSATPFVRVQFIAFRHNVQEISGLRQWAAHLGADDVQVKTAQVYDFAQDATWIPDESEWSRYRRDAEGRWQLAHLPERGCWKMWHSSVVTWDGQVVPCCFDKDAHHPMGNIQESGFEAVWKGLAYQAFRQQLLRSRSAFEMCRNCPEGQSVWRTPTGSAPSALPDYAGKAPKTQANQEKNR